MLIRPLTVEDIPVWMKISREYDAIVSEMISDINTLALFDGCRFSVVC